jgi:glycosyltransferase involved in cell wall biosynthesis
MHNSNILDVLLPVGPDSPYLEEALKSLILQNYQNWNLITLIHVSDTANMEKIKRIIPDKKNRFIFYTDPFNLSAVLNSGLHLSGAKYIARMDSDDILMPERLFVQINFLTTHPDIAIVGSSANIIDNHNHKIYELKVETNNDRIIFGLIRNNQFIHPTLMWNRELLFDSFYDTRLIIAQDYGFIMDNSIKFKIANLPQKLINYRIHSSNDSRKKISFSEMVVIANKKLSLAKFIKYNWFLAVFWIIFWSVKNIFISPMLSLNIRIKLTNIKYRKFFEN